MRVRFGGVIGGTVTVRRYETAEQALARAQVTLLSIMDLHARSLGAGDGYGPNLELELDDTPEIDD